MKTLKIKSIFCASIFWLTTGLANQAEAVTCQNNLDCANPALNYCKKDPGTCPDLGTCQPKPTACAAFYAPVCSCDGLDFPNECEAAKAGRNANYDGTCVICPDFDNDGACDGADNCEGNYNPDQADLDGDGIGDVCDPPCNTSQVTLMSVDDGNSIIHTLGGYTGQGIGDLSISGTFQVVQGCGMINLYNVDVQTSPASAFVFPEYAASFDGLNFSGTQPGGTSMPDNSFSGTFDGSTLTMTGVRYDGFPDGYQYNFSVLAQEGTGGNPGLPDVAAAPSNLDFGTVPIGNVSSFQTVTVSNNGTGPLSIDQLVVNSDGLMVCQAIGCAVIDPSAFMISNDTCSWGNIPQASSCTVDVAFGPLFPSTGPKVARLMIPSNDPDTSSLYIGLNEVDFIADSDGDGDGIPDSSDICPNDSTNTCTVYEDGEDAQTIGWEVHDGFPVTSTIANVNDPVRGSRVIELSGGGVSNAYALKGNGGAPWGNSGQKTLNFSVEFSEYFAVLVHLNTSNGPRLLTYVPINNSPMGSKVYVTHGLGSTLMNGQWYDFSRDLQADLNAAQPGNTILSVEGIIVRGSGRLDDISLQ